MDETRTRLYRILNERLNDGELRTLCFSLGVEYDDLPGQGKADKARELIAYLDRRHNLAQLAETLRQQRPDISVPEVPDKPGQDLPDKESVSSRNLPRAKYRWGALIGLGGLAIGIIAFVVTVATNKKPAAPTPPTAASLSAAPTLSATFTPTSLPIEPTVTHPPIEAPLDWKFPLLADVPME